MVLMIIITVVVMTMRMMIGLLTLVRMLTSSTINRNDPTNTVPYGRFDNGYRDGDHEKE